MLFLNKYHDISTYIFSCFSLDISLFVHWFLDVSTLLLCNFCINIELFLRGYCAVAVLIYCPFKWNKLMKQRHTSSCFPMVLSFLKDSHPFPAQPNPAQHSPSQPSPSKHRPVQHSPAQHSSTWKRKAIRRPFSHSDSLYLNWVSKTLKAVFRK